MSPRAKVLSIIDDEMHYMRGHPEAKGILSRLRERVVLELSDQQEKATRSSSDWSEEIKSKPTIHVDIHVSK